MFIGNLMKTYLSSRKQQYIPKQQYTQYMIGPFKLKTNICSELFSFQGLIVSYLYKDFGGARKTNAVPCIVYFLNLLRGKCRAKVGVAFYNYYSFRKVSFLLMRFRQLLFFNIAVNKILSFVFFQFFSFHFSEFHI